MHGLLQVQQTQALRAEPQVKERVEERVEAAVDVCQARGVRMSQKQEVEEATRGGCQVQVGQGIHAFQHMERRPAECEDHHQGGDDLEETPLLLVFLAQVAEMAGDRAADEAVADGHGQERQKKSKSGGGKAQTRNPKGFVILIVSDQAEVHCTGGAVVPGIIHCSAEQESWNSQQAREEPDGTQ